MQRREFISGFSASALLACAGTARAASSRRLVLLPAGGCDAGLYSDLNRALNDKARTKVIVTRGPSTEKAARDVLKNAPNGRFWLGGTSYGGAVALEILKIAPEPIAGLWLSGFFSTAKGSGRPSAMAKLIAEGQFAEVVRETGALVSSHGVRAEHVRRRIAHMTEALGAPTLAAQLAAISNRKDTQADLVAFDGPVLLTVGREDPLASSSEAESLLQLRGGRPTTVAVINDCGHYAALEQPVEVSRVLIDWLH